MIFKVMRFVLFYSDVESFNYFTDRIVEELNKKNHECFVLDLRDMSRSGEHSFERFNSFLEKKADAAIAFDGLGIKDRIFVELWDSMNTLAINILMDHPLRFHPTMLRHPRRYIQFCCDRNHVEYVKKYFGESVADVRFMPHAGTYMGEPDLENYEKRPYDVLFSGTFYEPHIYLEQIDEMFSDNELIKMKVNFTLMKKLNSMIKKIFLDPQKVTKIYEDNYNDIIARDYNNLWSDIDMLIKE